MNRLRKKTTATLLIAIFMISSFAVMVSAGAQKGWGKPEVRARAIGHFTSMTPGATEGHECFVNINARRVADGWTGRGVFQDEDYIGGKLVAIITVDSAEREDLLPKQIILHGNVEVSIADEYVGTYRFHSVMVPSWYVTFEIPRLPTYYLVHVWGTDIPVKITIEVLE